MRSPRTGASVLIVAAGLLLVGVGFAAAPGQPDRDAETGSRTGPDERLFLKGYRYFKQGAFIQSKKVFRQLLLRFPDSVRRSDSKYFLDRLKIRPSPSNAAPRIRVRLRQGASYRGKASDPLLVFNARGERVALVGRGQPWEVRAGDGGEVSLQAGERTRARAVQVVPEDVNGVVFFEGRPYRGRLEFRSVRDQLLVLNELPLNEYLYGVVRKEMAPNWPLEAIKTQAVASRSFALHRMLTRTDELYDVERNKFSQLYGGIEAETPRVRRAVDSTRGEVLTYRGRVVPAYFHANSGGYIETAESVWHGSPTPYIRPRSDPWSRRTRHATWQMSLARQRLNQLLQRAGFPGLAAEGSVEVVDRLPSGRATRLAYQSNRGGVTLKASRFRHLVGHNRLRSTWITRIRDRGQSLYFRGRGWGHGVGMSQWGAKSMAEQGRSYEDILGFFFTEARIATRYE